MVFKGKRGRFITVVHIAGAVFFGDAFYALLANAESRQEEPKWLFYFLCAGCAVMILALLFNFLTYFRLTIEVGTKELICRYGFIRRTYKYDTIQSVMRMKEANALSRYMLVIMNLMFNVYGVYEVNGKRKDFLLPVKDIDGLIALLNERISKEMKKEVRPNQH
jgi:hypothetical protein